jgi:hypothetical protein
VNEFSATGWDGSQWDLSHGPFRLTEQSMSVLLAPETTAFVKQSAYVDGQRLVSWKTKPREFDLQIATAVRVGELAWLALDRAWKRIMRPDKTVDFHVTDGLGGVRTLTMRMVAELPVLSVDASELRTTWLTYSMIADDPWWYGDPVVTTFDATADPVSFYGPTGYGPPFYLASASTPGLAEVSNRGDVDEWPVWTFYGPTPRFSARVAGRLVAGEFDIADGDTVTVDTRPFRKSALLSDGTNVTRALASRQFAPVPAGENVPVEVLTYGPSKSTLTLKPKFFRGY